MKNNPKYEQILQQQKEESETGTIRTEKQRRIDQLRQQLLAPQPKKESAAAAAKKADLDNDPMNNKFKRVMDWGTPRLVTKNR